MLIDEAVAGGWPQWNQQQENDLRRDLVGIADLPVHKAREKLLALERRHGGRRSLVWAELYEAQLACALQHLAAMATHTESSLAAGTVDDLKNEYVNAAWQVDNAVMRALAVVESTPDFEAVTAAIRAVYQPWLEASARHLQAAVDSSSYPGGSCVTAPSFDTTSGECVLFVDGLRFDTGKRLAGMLQSAGYEVGETPVWAALPSVTATGKPAVSPVRDQIHGEDANEDFEPAVATTGQSLKGGYHLKRLLKKRGWASLDGTNRGDGQDHAWYEFGDIDREGHDRGWKLARHLDSLLSEILQHITALLAAGWQQVRVVTDHGWLLLPGGLPRIELPSALTASKWGRCAALKSGAETKERLFPWYWNPSQHFVLADGVSCFKKGEEYAHGGLSLQECLTLELAVRGSEGSGSVCVEVTDMVWKGLRCKVAIDGACDGLTLDIRTHAGDAAASVVMNPKPLKEDGTASVVVEDEDLESQSASIVLLADNGALVAQVETVIGGEGT